MILMSSISQVGLKVCHDCALKFAKLDLNFKINVNNFVNICVRLLKLSSTLTVTLLRTRLSLGLGVTASLILIVIDY